MKPLTAGRVARRLLAFYNNDPKKWTQKQWGRTSSGEAVLWGRNPLAVCWCVSGAIEQVLKIDRSQIDGNLLARRDEAELVLSDALGQSVIGFNDSCKDFNEFKKKLHEIARTP